ncbi:MAG: nucleotide exchange factor GrpE [Phaeodactylibacter sp.]|nr:nucleotide exchange factor GrpE [Phaeodactylibacter sp.]MCB9048537.1 nucleotide exchange factor GrpE [Lewinellaceae bacterium]
MSDENKKNPKSEEPQDAGQVMVEQEEAQDAQAGGSAESGEASPLEEEIKKLKGENEELKDKYLRLFAEFDNFKKRTIREKMDMMKNAAQDTVSELLPILDDFDRAKKNAEQEGSTEIFSEGVSLVYSKLYATLRRLGLDPMETTGEVFDPELHEAITEIPAPAEGQKGRIIDTIEKGYMLNGKIIRHAKVVVGK